MTEVVYSPKIKPEHLARKAIVYLRQSSERQVRQNTESQLESGKNLGHQAASGVIAVPNRPSRTAVRT